MAKHFDPLLVVKGARSQRGYPMVWINDYKTDHFELVSDMILDFKGCMARMADRGIVAVGERGSYIHSQLGDLRYDDEKIVYDSAGWNNGVFVDGAKHVHAVEGALEGHAAFSGVTERFRAQGTIAQWRENVAKPLAGNILPEFFLGTMLVGPLIRYSGQSLNPGFMLVGPAEDGKSLLFKIIASACGAPSSDNQGDGYPLSFSGTNNGIEEEMQNYSDMTMIFDESALLGYGETPIKRGRTYIQTIMQLAQGVEKKRYKTRTRHFNFCFLTNSNDGLKEIVSGAPSREIMGALSSRLTTIGLKDRPQGVLDALPDGYSQKGDFLGALAQAAEQYHGTALPHMLNWLVKTIAEDPEGFKARLLDLLSFFREQATRGEPRRASRRTLDAFGQVYAAIVVGKTCGALPESFSALESTLGCYRLHLAATSPPARPVEIVAALLDDPTIDKLEQGERLRISKRRFESSKGYKVVCRRYTELIMSPAAADRNFDGWKSVHKHDEDISRILVREGSRPDTYRQIREEDRDRVVCFRVPPDWQFLRKL